MLQYTCNECGKISRLDDEMMNRIFTCPTCNFSNWVTPNVSCQVEESLAQMQQRQAQAQPASGQPPRQAGTQRQPSATPFDPFADAPDKSAPAPAQQTRGPSDPRFALSNAVTQARLSTPAPAAPQTHKPSVPAANPQTPQTGQSVPRSGAKLPPMPVPPSGRPAGYTPLKNAPPQPRPGSANKPNIAPKGNWTDAYSRNTPSQTTKPNTPETNAAFVTAWIALIGTIIHPILAIFAVLTVILAINGIKKAAADPAHYGGQGKAIAAILLQLITGIILLAKMAH